MRRASLLLTLLVAGVALAAPDFPRLAGRVVDSANMLSSSAENQIAAISDAHERATGNQVVVATLPDLQGYTIEEFGYQLGRAWGIGQKDKNNGVLLIVAQAERKVRIEVGYGLEGQLTDAVASNIISTILTPAFKRARFDEGTISGTTAIVDALGGEYKMREVSTSSQAKPSMGWNLLMLIVFLVIMPSMFGGGRFFGFMLLGSLLGGGRRSGRRGGGGGFGGFSGGGGSFGGGGASGGW